MALAQEAPHSTIGTVGHSKLGGIILSVLR